MDRQKIHSIICYPFPKPCLSQTRPVKRNYLKLQCFYSNLISPWIIGSRVGRTSQVIGFLAQFFLKVIFIQCSWQCKKKERLGFIPKEIHQSEWNTYLLENTHFASLFLYTFLKLKCECKFYFIFIGMLIILYKHKLWQLLINTWFKKCRPLCNCVLDCAVSWLWQWTEHNHYMFNKIRVNFIDNPIYDDNWMLAIRLSLLHFH